MSHNQAAVGYFDICDGDARIFDGDVVQLSERLMHTSIDIKAAPCASRFGLPGQGDRLVGRPQRVQSSTDIQPTTRGKYQCIPRIDRKYVAQVSPYRTIHDIWIPGNAKRF